MSSRGGGVRGGDGASAAVQDDDQHVVYILSEGRGEREGRGRRGRGVPSPGSGSVIVMYRWLFEPSCVRHSCHMAKRKVGV